MAVRPLIAGLFAAGLCAQEPHWAFVAPVRPPVPTAVGKDWVRNDVDRFVLEQAEARGLSPSPEASRAELLRRVTLDLTGLPPTPSELTAFENDDRTDAYERVVQRLLASEAAAEESTRLWLDLARYADTHGMQRDQVRSLWRWRDWVLDAQFAGMPFDRFVTSQLAGDLVPDATDAQRIASGFLRNNPSSDEGGLIPEEYLAVYAKSRTDAFGTALLGLTVGCAQCHDHKSDPLSQRDYYRLSAYFASFAEDGNDGGQLAPAPAIVAPRPHELAERERLVAAVAQSERELATVAWQLLDLEAEDADAFVVCDDGSLLAVGEVKDRATYVVRANGSLAQMRAMKLQVLPDDRLSERGPGRAENGNFVLGEIEVFALGAGTRQRVALAAAEADYHQDGHDAAFAIDGDAATGWAIQGRHEALSLDVTFEEPLPVATTSIEVRLAHETRHTRHLLGRFAILGTTAMALSPVRSLRASKAALAAYDATLPQCMVSGDLAAPRAVHVLVRGRYDLLGERVTPGTPSFLPPLPVDAPSDRRALAAWLFDRNHPLTARVAVNRMWQRHFGRGLVATPHDFGVLGARPSHAALLDWLACEFRASGWDERHVHTLLVTSATYRQSSRVDPVQRERDPDNVWLMRMSRQRLPAEAIRDQALMVGGLLVHSRGGPSVKIPQPLGIWEAVAFPGSNTERYVADSGDAIHRRSLYTFWKRTAPPPLMTLFDAPSREHCVVERQVTNTPLQVLALWNDEGLVEAAHGFAERCVRADGDDAGRVHFAFRTLLQRAPSSSETAACIRLLEQSASEAPQLDPVARWAVVTNLLLSLDEALHRN